MIYTIGIWIVAVLIWTFVFFQIREQRRRGR